MLRYLDRIADTAMERAMKKFLIGFACLAILCMVGGAGYRFGQYLADRDHPAASADGI